MVARGRLDRVWHGPGWERTRGVLLITPDGTQERELLGPSDAFRRFGGFTRDGSKLAYATTERNGREFDIHLLDVASGEDRELFRGRLGLYAVSWHPNGAAVILSEARGEDANDLCLLDVKTGEVEVLFKPKVASRYASFSWVPDGTGFYLVTDHEREYAALAYYDLTERGLRFIDTPEQDVSQAALSHDGRWLLWAVNDGGYSVLKVQDLSTDETVPAPALPRGSYRVEWASGASVVAVSVSGPQIPGDVWLWTTGSGDARRVTHSSAAGLDLSTMVIPTHHSLPARDGTIIHGPLYRPTGPVDGDASILLSVHGGPTGQATPRFNGPHQYLLSRGIAVFDLNYRGSTGYGKTFARANDRRLRTNELYDLEDAVRWLGTVEGLDASRVAIMGGSYGGYLTMAGLARLPHLFTSGVAFVGVSNWLTALEGASPQLQASDRIEYGDISDPNDREFFREICPIHGSIRVSQ